MNDKLVFYTNPMSRGRIVRWMLEELAIPYETEVLQYGSSIKNPEYLALNPMGKVPAIKHGNVFVTETAAICAYLADAFADKNLAPQTLDEKARYYRWMFFVAGPLEQAIGLKLVGAEITSEHQKSLGCGNPSDTFKTLAKAVSETPYIAGDRFTAADVIVASYIGFYTRFKLLDEVPEFTSYLERVYNRPARIKANQLDDSLLQNSN